MPSRRVTIKSLAKINLDLRVLNQRPDGFHELRTVFHTISIADTIDIEYEPARRTEISMDDPLAIPDNLVLKAGQAVLDALKIHARVHFRLRKKIPMGGGLGGGSSNAAAVLLALPMLVGRSLAVEPIAASLGSDVPFFLTGGSAAGIGRGTEVYELPELRPEPILIISPGLHVATGPAYQALGRGLTADDSSSKINSFQAFVRVLASGRSAKVASPFSANDFEAVVFRQFPQLQTIVRKLSQLGMSGARPGVRPGVRMTGSGSAIFAIFGSRQERDRAETVLKGDRVLGRYLVMPAALVNRGSYQKLWRRQLNQHIRGDQSIWPLQSRYVK
jgi:4-diphosphocytidyl-2-C-methyl-D-erythritol kinase